jgi:small subunit ribosomal protein S1
MIIKKETPKDPSSPFSIGSTIEGKVVARDRSSLYIDLGIHGTGIIYGREFYAAKNIIKSLQVGDKVYAKIVDMENDEGYKELSLKDATKDISWGRLKELKDSGEVINVKITGVNKGGLLASLEGVQAFLPVSQLAPENYPRVADADKQKILKELQKFIGKTMEVKVLDLLAEENKLILSEKAKSEEKMKAILKDYRKGDVVEGEITGIADFGAFIKFPVRTDESKEQIEGLIHISELDWQLVENPAEVVKVGEVVKVQIIDINNNQVFLSLKALKQNPWEKIEKEYKKGDVIKGKVTKFSAFGAFVEIAPKIRGLCHISEFASKEDMEKQLELEKTYDFQVLQIEPKEHRMSLKLVAK